MSERYRHSSAVRSADVAHAAMTVVDVAAELPRRVELLVAYIAGVRALALVRVLSANVPFQPAGCSEWSTADIAAVLARG